MQTYLLTQTGAPDLEIQAEKLCYITTHAPSASRWYEVTVYHREDGYTAQVAYRSDWKGEVPGHYEVGDGESAEEIIELLKAYDPCQYARLRPENTEDEKKVNKGRNEDIRRGLRRQWDGLISEVARALQVTEKRGPGRTNVLGEDSDSIGLRLPRGLLQSIDAARGKVSRSEWLRMAAEEKLSKEAP